MASACAIANDWDDGADGFSTLADSARAMGLATVTIVDDDLGRSGSCTIGRSGFQKLVASVCSGTVCIEASRLARNGRDWHDFIDLCALVGALVIDRDGTYDPRLVNDRLLLGLKGTMSEYELSLLRQRGLAARDSKASRGELRLALPPGYCWNEIGQIEMDPDERVAGPFALFSTSFANLAARQVKLWAQDGEIKLPATRRSTIGRKIEWGRAAYHSVLQILRHPVYAGAYVFGRTTNRTRVVDGRARQATGRSSSKPLRMWVWPVASHTRTAGRKRHHRRGSLGARAANAAASVPASTAPTIRTRVPLANSMSIVPGGATTGAGSGTTRTAAIACAARCGPHNCCRHRKSWLTWIRPPAPPPTQSRPVPATPPRSVHLSACDQRRWR
jgi:DNA invertase Pin-like site-specific DNA recombinase